MKFLNESTNKQLNSTIKNSIIFNNKVSKEIFFEDLNLNRNGKKIKKNKIRKMIITITYSNGSTSTKESIYSRSGNLISITRKKSGVFNGLCTEYETTITDGIKKRLYKKIYNFKNGLKNGEQRLYHEGVLVFLENYKNGKRHGVFSKINKTITGYSKQPFNLQYNTWFFNDFRVTEDEYKQAHFLELIKHTEKF